MCNKKISFGIFITILALAVSVYATEELTITTYYPSPYGSYRELRSQRMAIGNTYYNPAGFCWPGDTCTATIPDTASLVVEGNVGIGTANPSSQLELVSTNPFVGHIGLGDEGGNLWFDGGSNGIALIQMKTPGGKISFTNSSAAETVQIMENGRLGVGATNPTAKFEVNLVNGAGWGGNLKAFRMLSPDNNYYLDVNHYIVGAGNVGYQFSPNTNTGMVITTPGNVGIGMTNPIEALQVNGNIRATNGYSVGTNKIGTKVRYGKTAVQTVPTTNPVDFVINYTGFSAAPVLMITPETEMPIFNQFVFYIDSINSTQATVRVHSPSRDMNVRLHWVAFEQSGSVEGTGIPIP